MGASRDDILDHLLDRVIPAAYAQPPGEPIPAYTAESARNVLGRLAARMNQDETRDLQWWRLRAIIPSPARIFAASLVCGFVGLLTGALCAGALKIEFLAQNDPSGGGGPGVLVLGGAVAGLTAGIVVGLIGSLLFGWEVRAPSRAGAANMRKAFLSRTFAFGLLRGLLRGLAGALVGAAVTGLLVGPIILLIVTIRTGGDGGTLSGLMFYALYGAVIGTIVGLTMGLIAAVDTALTRSGAGIEPMRPADSWHADRTYRFLMAAPVWAVVTPALLLIGRLEGAGAQLEWVTATILIGLGTGLAIGLTYPATGGARLAFTYLCLRWHTPLRLMRFLEDATDCGVLRTVGPTYQFRHARLQDRLASTTPLPTRKCGVSKLGYRS